MKFIISLYRCNTRMVNIQLCFFFCDGAWSDETLLCLVMNFKYAMLAVHVDTSVLPENK